MPNPHRGEIEARLDGAPYRLCLTLGALAELEHAFGDTDMLALAERFQSGRLSARDAQRIIAAGLRGAGHDIADEAVARMQADGGAAGFVDIVARLLAATFGGAGVRPSAPSRTTASRTTLLGVPRRDAPRPPLSLGRRDGRRPRPPASAARRLLVHDPKELEAALRGLLGPATSDAPLPRAALAGLMARFPD